MTASEPSAAPDADLGAMAPLERYRPMIVADLRSILEQRSVPPFSLMRYHLGWEDERGRPVEARGGKLLRPALCLLTCEALGGDAQRALPAATALELLHNFTLIHDDIEDASAERHGRETIWKLWGEAQAINVGDGMFALAHVTLLGLADRGHAPDRVLRAARMLDEASLRLCEGQHADLLFSREQTITRDDYLTMIEGKTAVLVAASSGIGALLAGADGKTVDALHEFGRRLGLAFQVRDDVLGIWGDPRETGKPVGDDLRAGKKSLPIVIGLENAPPDARAQLLRVLGHADAREVDVRHACDLLARLDARDESEQAARDHADAAVASLTNVSLDDERRAELEDLARFAAKRNA